MAGPSSERAVILAPKGRDASLAAALIREAGYQAQACGDLPALLSEIEGGAGLAVIADEAIKTADLRGLVKWLNDQPPWSDFPIVLLTHQGGGPERNPDAARLGEALGNVTFLERPFHPTTLVSIVGSAIRGRRRQYETRAILADLTEGENLLQTALNAGLLGALELHLPDCELEASDICIGFFGGSRASILPTGICRRRFIPTTGRGALRCSIRPLRRAAITTSNTAMSGPTVRSTGSTCAPARCGGRMAASDRLSAFAPTSPPARRLKSSEIICSPNWRPNAPRWPN